MKHSYPMVKRPDHPLAPLCGIVAVHHMVLFDRIGWGVHDCHWCGRAIEWNVGHKRKMRALLVDHVDGDRRNFDPLNLVPSCHRCNVTRMRSDMIKDGEPIIRRSDGVVARATRRTCKVCGQEFLIESSQLRYRKARFCSRACRNKGVAAESGAGIQPGELFIEKKVGEKTKRLRATQRECEQCGAGFLAETRMVRKGLGRFCSGACSARSREGKKRKVR